VLSLDFLAGFTIFLLALIMVVSMVPGLLAGLQSSGIDYDAVAYRTGVILVEDPGWPVNPLPWEQYGRDHKDEIQRMGLAVSKDTPNILLSTKVERFFNKTFFDQDDYHNKVIFGDYPYSYNISLSSGNDLWQTGDPLPPGYGYIRRVVKIKEPSVAVINESFKDDYTIPNPSDPKWNSTARNFTVRLDFGHLLNSTVSPAYRIDPRIEPVNVTNTDFGEFLNRTDQSVDRATLKSVTFQKAEPDSPPVPLRWLSYSEEEPDLYTLHLDEISHNLTPNEPVNSSISLVLKPAFMTFMGPNSILDIRFNFEDDPPQTNITGTHPYDYVNVTRTDLKTGVLKVAIW